MEVEPAVGQVHDGTAAIQISAVDSVEPGPALATTVSVEPSHRYRLVAWVSALHPQPVPVPVTLVAGEASTTLPDVDAWWVPVVLEFDTAEDQTELEVQLVVEGAVDGLLVDDLSLISLSGAAGAEPANLLANPSFESLKPDAEGVVNTSLVLDSRTATLAVALPEGGSATWSIRSGETELAGGAITGDTPVTAVPLEGVAPGMWELHVEGVFETTHSISTLIALIDGVVDQDDRLGVHIHSTSYSEGGVEQAAELGFGSVRFTVPWRNIEEKPGKYKSAKNFRGRIDIAHARDMEVLAIAPSRHPLYDDGRTPSSPEGLAALAAVTAWVVDKYDIDAVEVYNEFNHEPFNDGACGLDAECYLDMLRAVSDAVRAVAPDTRIVAGATAQYVSNWFDELWSLGGLQYADAESFHPYSIYFAPEEVESIVQHAISIASEYGTPPGVWISEMGWTTEEGGFSPMLQAEMLIRGQVSAIAGGVERVFWYDLVDDDPEGKSHEGAFGLFRQRIDGVTALPPKPAAVAQAVLAAEIGGLPYVGSEDRGPGVVTKVFGDGPNQVRVVWAPGGSGTVAFNASGPVRVVSATGEVSGLDGGSGSVSIDVTASPVFISGVE